MSENSLCDSCTKRETCMDAENGKTVSCSRYKQDAEIARLTAALAESERLVEERTRMYRSVSKKWNGGFHKLKLALAEKQVKAKDELIFAYEATHSPIDTTIIDLKKRVKEQNRVLQDILPAMKAAYAHGTSLSIGKMLIPKIEQALTSTKTD